MTTISHPLSVMTFPKQVLCPEEGRFALLVFCSTTAATTTTTIRAVKHGTVVRQYEWNPIWQDSESRQLLVFGMENLWIPNSVSTYPWSTMALPQYLQKRHQSRPRTSTCFLLLIMSSASSDNHNAGSNANNPGHVLASAVDAEIANFRGLQGELQDLRQDLSTVMGQETENEMVLLEFNVLDDDATVYKLLGPTLLPQDLAESKMTVTKRLEFIRKEKGRLEKRVQETEERGNALAVRIQQMQAGLQQSTAEAVRAIAQQHGGSTAAS